MFVADYARLAIHRLMLSDRVRMEAYRKALSATVRPGDAVLDAGGGTAIMGMLAARAGARAVYSVEQTSIGEIARQLVRRNGLEGQVKVIQSDLESVTLPERVDVLVAEWMGCYGVDENLLSSVVAARDKWLKPEGRLLPEVVAAWMAPVEDPRLIEEMQQWRERPYGLDFGAIAEASANEVRMGQHQITAETLVAGPQQLWATDVRTISAAEAGKPFSAQVRFTASRSGTISALAAWFAARFPDGSTLTNAPDGPWTHWGRAVLPLYAGIAVEQGVPVEVELTCAPGGEGFCHQEWSVRVGEREWEHHDTRRDVTLAGGSERA